MLGQTALKRPVETSNALELHEAVPSKMEVDRRDFDAVCRGLFRDDDVIRCEHT
jgi:hypothetical protein